MINISNVIESVKNPEGRFATLRGMFPSAGSGSPDIRSGSGYCDIGMIGDGVPVNLRVFLQKDKSACERLTGISALLAALEEPVYGRFAFHENELLVFDDAGGCAFLDVAVWDQTEILTLPEYIGEHTNAGNRKWAGGLNKILRQLAAFAPRHFVNKLDMGGLGTGAFRVDKTGNIILSGFERAKRGDCTNDIKDLATLFCRVYLVFSDRRFNKLTADALATITGKHYGILPDAVKKIHGLLAEGGDAHCLVSAMAEAVEAGIEISGDIPAVLDEEGIGYGANGPSRVSRTKFEFVGEMSCMLMRAFDGEKWCYLDKNGKIAIPGPFVDASDFWEGIARVEVETERMGVIDTLGNLIIPAIYDDLEFDLTGNRLIVTIDGRSALMLRSGEMLTGFDYDHIATQSEGIYMVWKKEKLGFISRDGKKITDIIYEDGDSFNGGRAKVSLHGRRYVIGTDGEVIDEIIA